MSLCRPIKTGISTQCALHQLCASQRGHSTHQWRCASQDSMQQCISGCISIRPARIGSLAPPNCWRATHGQKFLPPPAPKSFDTCAFFTQEKWGDRSREQFRHVAELLGIAVFCTFESATLFSGGCFCLRKTLMDF